MVCRLAATSNRQAVIGIREYAIIGLAIALMLALGTAHYYHSEYKVVEAQYEGFVDKTESLGKVAEANKKLTETLHDTQIATARSERDAAVRLLDVWKKSRPSGSILSGIPASPQGIDRICFTRTGLDAALQRYTGGVEDLIGAGQAAVIDSRAWAKAWPSQAGK